MLKELLTGLSFPQEYLCLDKSAFRDSPRLLHIQAGKSKDVTDSHLFLGYRPLIIAIISDERADVQESSDEITLKLVSNSDDQIAQLKMKKFAELKLYSSYVMFLEGVEGRHTFIRTFYQHIASVRERSRKRKMASADLDGNLYDQVRIAYAIPRTISLITVQDNGLINVFPTDLHGPVGTTAYISSLRKDGMANSQVEILREIVLSEISADRYKQVYALGKNHMKSLREKGEFELDGRISRNFGHPLPKGTVAYRELKQVSSFDHGIHRIHVYEVVHRHRYEPAENDSMLSHIHCYYGQWRRNHKIESSYLIR